MPIAKSLEKLKAQLDAMFPQRSKVSDGAYGDSAHSKRKSDHNPNAQGYVTARDFTFDNNPSDGVGIDCHWLAKVLFESKDKRIKYLIWNGKITTKDKTGWKAYSGINPHKHHLHISVASDISLYNDESEWNLGKVPTTPQKPVQEPVITIKSVTTIPPNTELEKGAKNIYVGILQKALVAKGFLKEKDVDNDFGTRTQTALQEFQLSVGIVADGIFGNNSRKFLGI